MRQEAAYLGEVEEFDAVVLDLGLPCVDGLTVLRGWRAAGRRHAGADFDGAQQLARKVAGMDAGR